LRVLVVDDYADARASLRILLELWGHDAREAADGEEALRVADAFEPHAFLLDLGMPRIDGFAVARHLRRDARFANALLVAISGYGQEKDVAQARAAGFDLHLIKPIDLDVLEDLLRHRQP
jgi:CheY-like chemotaxis protein